MAAGPESGPPFFWLLFHAPWMEDSGLLRLAADSEPSPCSMGGNGKTLSLLDSTVGHKSHNPFIQQKEHSHSSYIFIHIEVEFEPCAFSSCGGVELVTPQTKYETVPFHSVLRAVA